MSKQVNTIDAFLNWARTKDPKEEFSPCQGECCALQQYGEFLGIPNTVGGTRQIHEMNYHKNVVIRSITIRGLDGTEIFWKQYERRGKYRNNFGNLIEALERSIEYDKLAFAI